jgi:type IV pilus assembly protein PilY1
MNTESPPRPATRLRLGAGLALLACGAPVLADIASFPLFVGIASPPNAILAVDDSYSMHAEILMGDGLDTYPAGPQAAYLFPDNSTYSKISPFFGTKNIPPLPYYADTRSPDYNRAYFNPTLEYPPWVSFNTQFGPADPTQAPWDPMLQNSGLSLQNPAHPQTFNLTQDIQLPATGTAASAYGFTFNASGGSFVIPTGTSYKFGSQTSWNLALTPVTLTSKPVLAVKYFPATFYLKTDSPLLQTLTDQDYGYTGSRPVVTNKDSVQFYRYEIKPANFGSTNQYNQAIQNFANWFTYYRKRHQATRAAIGYAFQDVKSLNLGIFRINNPGPTNTPLPLIKLGTDDESLRRALLEGVYGYSTFGTTTNSGLNTPNMTAVDWMGQQFQQPGTIASECSRNVGILFTDGNAEWAATGHGNVDGTTDGVGGGPRPPYADGTPDTLADTAMDYYKTNLNPALPAGQVPTPGCPNPARPELDCQANLHMNFYAVNLGLRGDLYDPTANPPIDPYQNPPQWPDAATLEVDNPNSLPRSRQDDLWHATINGRGKLLSAQRPTEIRDKLGEIIRDVASKSGSASSVATTSAYLSSDTLVFLAKFDSSDWSGDLVAQDVSGNVVWETPGSEPGQMKVSGSSYGYRQDHVFSFNPEGCSGSKGIAFEWNCLSDSQKSLLNQNYDAEGEDAADSLGADRVEYLKGDTSKETRNGGAFRDRYNAAKQIERLFGDFVDSTPVFVGTEDFGYSLLPGDEGSSYDPFLSGKQTRTKMLYLGSNDGLLHALNATNSTDGGREVFGYVPNSVYKYLYRLTAPDYAADTRRHKYYVDGPPWVGDAYLSGSWKSILIGTTGAGGQGVFALDVTHPDGFGASNVLWEFANPDPLAADPPNHDLGYTLSTPTLVRTNDDSHPWVALVANGPDSKNGHAVLFVLDLGTGDVLRKFDTQAGGNSVMSKNGLSSPIAIDTNQDRKADLAYAGDLTGNLWKFDLTAEHSSEWKIAFGTEASPEPLFTACAEGDCSADGNRQPITDKPQVGRSKDAQSCADLPGLMVYFGTGKYFENGDNIVSNNPRTESFYGIRDDGAAVSRANLVAQTIDGEEAVGLYTVRVTSNNPVEYANGNQGWYLDLKLGNNPQGERSVSDSVLHDGRITFTTFTPAQASCAFGGSGWIMELDALTGGALTVNPGTRQVYGSCSGNSPLFDLNGDGRLDASDLTPGGAAPSGLGINAIPTSTRIVRDGAGILRVTGTSNSDAMKAPGPGSNTEGRLSWRAIR